MKKVKHCFIRENDSYIEISYSEIIKNGKRTEKYKDRFFICVSDCLLDVPEEDYENHNRDKRRQKYLKEEAILHNEISYHQHVEDDVEGEELIEDKSLLPIDEIVEQKHEINELRKAILKLTIFEQDLIHSLYFKNMSERDYATEKNVYHNAIHKQKKRILKKLKKFL